MRKGYKAVVVFFGVMLLVLGMAFFGQTSAQVISGDLVGTVMDKTGAVVPSARVEATKVDTGVKYETKANENGEYRFNNPADWYLQCVGVDGELRDDDHQRIFDRIEQDQYAADHAGSEGCGHVDRGIEHDSSTGYDDQRNCNPHLNPEMFEIPRLPARAVREAAF